MEDDDFINMVSSIRSCVESLKTSSEASLENIQTDELKMLLLQNVIDGFDQVITNLEKIMEVEKLEEEKGE